MEPDTQNQLMTVDEKVISQLGAISPMLVVEQVRFIQTIMSSVMRKDEHYGMIPGTNKNCLYKSGAEKLCFTFQLIPEFLVDERNLENGHREYVVTCHLTNASGRRVATGVGSCSTMESKYRYRGNELKPTGMEVPSSYWDTRKTNAAKAQDLIGGKGFATKKDDDGKWRIYEKGEKGENPDIADVYNTVLKIGKKRAHVDAAITATAASDIFTQDVDDLPQQPEFFPEPPATPKAQQPTTPVQGAAKPASKPPNAQDAEFTEAPQKQAPPPSGSAPSPAAQSAARGIPPEVLELLNEPNPEEVAKQRILMTKLGIQVANRNKELAEALKADWRNSANAGVRIQILEKAKAALRELCA